MTIDSAEGDVPTIEWPVPSWIPHRTTTDCEGLENRVDRTLMREGGRCIYCERDLVCDVELLLASELDHLIPKEVFRAAARKGYTRTGDYRTNLVFCCGPCNDAKANWPLCLGRTEAIRYLQSATRAEYLAAAKAFVLPRRRTEEKRVARLMAKVWAQRVTRLEPLTPSPKSKVRSP